VARRERPAGRARLARPLDAQARRRGRPTPPDGPVRDHEGAPADGGCDCVGLTRAGAERVLAVATGHPDPAILLAAAWPEAAAGPKGAAVRYGAPPREDRTEAALRACALDLLRGAAA
jgi:hypothetical protein